MPDPIAQAPVVDLDRLSDASATLPVPPELGYNAITRDAQLWPKFQRFENKLLGHYLFGPDSDYVEPGTSPYLEPDEANAQYGVPGYLRFNRPVLGIEAEDMAAAAHERRYRDQILSRTNLNPLRSFAAGMQGSMVDPIGTPLMLLGGEMLGGIKAAGAGLEGLEGAGAAARVYSGLGRVGNMAWGAPRLLAEGAVANLPYVAADYGLRNSDGDDMSGGDALRDLAAGAIFHTTLHYGGKGARMALDHFGGRYRNGGPIEGMDASQPIRPQLQTDFTPEVPEAVQDLPPASRMGAFVKAIDDATEDRPVDVGRFVERERAGDPQDLGRLGETAAIPGVDIRLLDEASAVTPRGTEVPVRYGLVEARDLVTSHDNELNRNPDYPQALQPRDRERVGAVARNYTLENELNPKLLMHDVSAAAGAPIVAPDGTVESGNGRTIALRRSAETGTPAYGRYLAELKAQGLPVDGMEHPVLVRMRTQPMEGAQRVSLAREMNADVVERMSATEQAMADAKGLDDATVAHLTEGEPTAAGNRAFARGFLARVAPDAQNSLVAPDGALSAEGARRLKAAIVAKAYGDPRLVEALFEAADPNIKAIGGALGDAAPAWMGMRSAASRGEIPPDVDLTDNLRSAVDLIRHARDEGMAPGEMILDRLGQTEMFSNEDAISPETEAFLRLFYRDGAFQRPRSGARIAEALKDYARQALETKPGPDLFGDVADASTARQILANLAERFGRPEDAAGDLAELADTRAEAAGGQEPPPRHAVLDVREPGQGGERGGPGPGPADGEGPGGGGGEPGSVPGSEPQTELGFTTAKGSTYTVDAEGRTTRDKAFRPEHGEAEQGPQPKSEATYYVTAEAADALGEIQTQGGPSRVVAELPDGRLGVRYEAGKDAGKFEKRTVVSAERQPQTGLTPVEIWEGGRKVHFGNEIVEVKQPVGSAAKPGPLEAQVRTDPELKALADATDRLAAAHGLEPPAVEPAQDPATIAKAMDALASCAVEAASELLL